MPSRVGRLSDETITIDGNPVEKKLTGYYVHYAAIADYLKTNPDNISGAYEAIWENGGGN